MKIDVILGKVQEIINQYPKSKNKQPYLVLHNGRKLFFNRFIKKYGINGKSTSYKASDLKRRLVLVEFFPYFTQLNLITARAPEKLLLESEFYRMVILDKKDQKGNSKYELLSFYPK